MEQKIKSLNLKEIKTIKDDDHWFLKKMDYLYSSSIPNSSEFFNYLKEQKISTIIDLKNDGEEKINEKALSKEYGVNRISLPVSSVSDISFEFLKKVHDIISQSETPTLIYCVSANRVGALIALYLSKYLGHNKECALKVGKEMGLKKAPLIKAIEDRF